MAENSMTEAQKRAQASYRKRNVKQLVLKFAPPEQDLLDWLRSQPEPTATLIKDACRDLRETRENPLTASSGTTILAVDGKEDAACSPSDVDCAMCEYLLRQERLFLEDLLSLPDAEKRRVIERRLRLLSSVLGSAPNDVDCAAGAGER